MKSLPAFNSVRQNEIWEPVDDFIFELTRKMDLSAALDWLDESTPIVEKLLNQNGFTLSRDDVGDLKSCRDNHRSI